MAAKSIGFGGGHLGVGAGCSSGDDGVAGATGSPSAGKLKVAKLLLLFEAWSPSLEVLPPVTVVTDSLVMVESVSEGARFVVV